MAPVVPLILAIVVLSCLIASPAATESVRDAALTYSPWTKFCLRGQRADTAQVCFIGKDGRAVDGPYLVAAVLIEQNGETKKTLRVTLRPPVKLDRGVRIAVDQGQAITLRYTHCFAQSYMADYESDAGLIAHT